MKNMKLCEVEMETQSETDKSEEEAEADCDSVDQEVLLRDFKKFEKTCEKIVGPQKYVLHIDGTPEENPTLIAGLSNGSAEVLHLGDNQIARVCELKPNPKTFKCDSTSGVKISSENNNLIYVGNEKGLFLWDLRAPKAPASQFVDSSSEGNKIKVITSFDVSQNNRVVTGGTETLGGDAYLLFWDVRKASLLGGYWESHTDDVTQVAFHPFDPNKLISGSTDGLINVYDLAHTCEDDALVESLNTESSIERLRWHCSGLAEMIGCVTHTNDLQLWKMEECKPFIHLNRAELAIKARRKSEGHCCLIGTHGTNDGGLFALLGSNFQGDPCLRSLRLKKRNWEPHQIFTGNRQIVRSSWHQANLNILVAGGENGVVSVWRL